VLFLIFQSGKDRYGLDASRVTEVVPFAALKQVPHAPEGMIGLLNYRGVIVPVIDLAAILSGVPSRAWLSTRIILVDVSGDAAMARMLGFVVERVTETFQCPEENLQASGVAVSQAPYLGKIMLDQDEMIQHIDPTAIIPESLREALFTIADCRV